MDFVDAMAGLLGLVNVNDHARGKKTLLRIAPLGEENNAVNWLINFSVENFTESDIPIAPIVTATFKTGTGDSDIAFIISGQDTTIPAKGKKSFSASARNQNARPAPPYSLHQVHVTTLY
jgi:hypothetical protein